jgi:uncharacterized protein (DUF1499 family)
MNAQRRKLTISVLILLPVLLISGLLIMSLFGHRPDDLGIKNGQLKPCPKSPNCVCSYAEKSDSEHSIDPLTVPSGYKQPMETLKEVVSSLPRMVVVDSKEDYLRVELTSALMRYVDDVEFQWLADESVIHVRSASRIGRSDLGVNRKRVEKIRELWQSAVEQ